MILRRAAFLLAAITLMGLPNGAAAQTPYVPPELEPWSEWVLDGLEAHTCPLTRDGRSACFWPGRLTLRVTGSGGEFRQSIDSHIEQNLPLPGDRLHWPTDVRVDDRPAPVVDVNGRPHVRVGAGTVELRGRFEWARPPAALPMDGRTGMVALWVDGQQIDQPRWQNGTVWIRQDQSATNSATANRLDLTVYRTIIDGAPPTMNVSLKLDVAGDSREEVLGRLLPEGFEPAYMASPLPARLDADGNVRVQARPGTWTIEFRARTQGPLTSLAFAPSGEFWPEEEVWSYRSAPRLRVTEATGDAPVDPAQVGVPADARQLPAWRMLAGQSLTIEERQRGFSQSVSNRFTLARELWMGFDRDGYIARDQISGTMVRDWRLDLSAPLQLQSATLVSGDNLLVTQNPDDAERRGVEVRTPAVALNAVSRLEGGANVLPVSGWQTNVAGVNTTVHLPPGTRLLAAPGVDDSQGDWASKWNLLDFFLVLIVAAALWRLYAPWIGVVGFCALALSVHEPGAPLWSWLWLVGASAAHRFVPPGKLARAAAAFRAVALLVFAVIVVPFAANQLKWALYPQLEYNIYQAQVAPGAVAPAEAVVTDSSIAQESRSLSLEEAEDDRMGARAQSKVQSRRYAASPAPQALNRYAKTSQVQAGPGVPSWRWRTHRLSWSGPVAPDQTHRLIVLSPWMMSVWRVLMIALTLGVVALILRRDLPLPKRAGRTATSALALLMGVALTGMPTQEASAQMPSPEMLQDLRQRLLRKPDCSPNCITIERAAVRFDEQAATVILVAHAQEQGTLPIPGESTSWHATEISVDGQANPGLLYDNGQFLLRLSPGVHRIMLRGALPNANSVTLSFALNPYHVDVDGSGWETTGLTDGRLSGSALTLIRQRDSTENASGLDAIDVEQFPAFVTIERTLNIDLDWTVTTVVRRVTPQQSPINLRVPLLSGEAVNTANLSVLNGVVSVNIPAGQAQTTWTSTLERSTPMQLNAAGGMPWQELWRINTGANWRVTHAGVPADNIDPSTRPYWQADFTPWPGESLTLNISRPEAVDGPTLAIEAAQLSKQVGRRGSESSLSLSYQATKGGQHVLTLPAGVELAGVRADGRELALALDGNTLTLPIVPGSHAINVNWRDTQGAGLRLSTDAVDLGIEAANLATSLSLPRDRWVLLSHGPRVGPAVLYWSELLVFVLAALILARVARTPLRFYHWLLLGIGFSTFFWPAFALFAVTMLAFRWREQTQLDSYVSFNFAQVILAGLFVTATLSLLSTVPLGLLGSPDMHVSGNGSNNYFLQWFVDRSSSTMPSATVLSAPLWIYKGLILLWSLWLAFALLRWLPWLWSAYSKGGYWHEKPRIETPVSSDATE